MGYEVTEREMKEFTKAMNEWKENKRKRKERFEKSLLYKIYSFVKEKGKINND